MMWMGFFAGVVAAAIIAMTVNASFVVSVGIGFVCSTFGLLLGVIADRR